MPQSVDAPEEDQLHDAKGWHVVVIPVVIIVIVLACAGVSPEWVSTGAAVIGVAMSYPRRS